MLGLFIGAKWALGLSLGTVQPPIQDWLVTLNSWSDLALLIRSHAGHVLLTYGVESLA